MQQAEYRHIACRIDAMETSLTKEQFLYQLLTSSFHIPEY